MVRRAPGTLQTGEYQSLVPGGGHHRAGRVSSRHARNTGQGHTQRRRIRTLRRPARFWFTERSGPNARRLGAIDATSRAGDGAACWDTARSMRFAPRERGDLFTGSSGTRLGRHTTIRVALVFGGLSRLVGFQHETVGARWSAAIRGPHRMSGTELGPQRAHLRTATSPLGTYSKHHRQQLLPSRPPPVGPRGPECCTPLGPDDF